MSKCKIHYEDEDKHRAALVRFAADFDGDSPVPDPASDADGQALVDDRKALVIDRARFHAIAVAAGRYCLSTMYNPLSVDPKKARVSLEAARDLVQLLTAAGILKPGPNPEQKAH